MQERVVKFISALRTMGVRVSLAETADAFKAIEKLGIQDRNQFRLSLRATLVKDAADLDSFDELFPLFFDANTSPPLMDLLQDLSPEEADKLAEAIRQMNERLQEMLERLARGEELSQEELEQLGQMVGVSQADDLHYQDWMSRRMEQALQFQQVQEALQELMETLRELGMDEERLQQMGYLMDQNLDAIREQIRQYVGSRIAENLTEPNREDGIDQLMNRPFNALSDKDMKILREEVRRLAAILRSRVSLRQKRAKSGQLDPKATIRSNLKHGGVPFEIKYKDRNLKPKLVVICDISTSMRYCSELMLTLLHAMQDLISKTNAFAFIDHLEFITPDFVGKQANEAVDSVLVRMPPGYYSTDLGYALRNFNSDYMDTIDSRTTLIMVGDGRNNYNDPQAETFRTMARRSRRAIWINPEPQTQWGTGDSDMWKYAPYCNDILRASTLSELTNAVEKLLN
ncbi:MAG: VWA domain-containing protein [Chloroflexi bacterium]|nr:MAG: VWA domain-containing protein [Chloroflexota bacterium]MBL1196032.1 VWA domain-containing protein [Chloroflexota bacterium]NOH13326.1 VWA domain-containing protein [Chloroflexota bacterium]